MEKTQSHLGELSANEADQKRKAIFQEIVFHNICQSQISMICTYLFNMEPKVKQFIISIIDLNLQANLEEFVANEKVDDESDSDDTDSGTLHLVNKSSTSNCNVMYRPRSGVVLARADSWTLENVQERLQKMEEVMMI